MSLGKVLIVDDEKSMRDFLSIVLKKEGYEPTVAPDGEAAVKMIHRDIFDLVMTDIRMPKVDGLGVLREVKNISPDTIVLMMTAFASTETAVAAMREGAYDYISKPFQIEEVKHTLKNALEKKHLREENVRLKRELKEQTGFESIISRSDKMRKVLDLARKVSDSNSNVLIFGESGTGKEVVAQAIHYNSHRRDRSFVTVNCSALPESLLESELFGHVKGSFTGAIANKEGLFEVAHEGTLFLDEIGDTSPAIQAKLLRVLQEREFRRIGGVKDIKVDVRIIAATNKDLEKAVSEGSFREDLYYRLDVIPIYLPSLRDRLEDVAPLADFFLKRYAQRMNKTMNGLMPESLKLLMTQEWRGNVRELENVIERAVALATTERISPEHLEECLQRPLPQRQGLSLDLPPEGMDLEGFIDGLEMDLLRKALSRSGGLKKAAAALLGLNFRSFRYRLEKFGMNKPTNKEDDSLDHE